MLLLVGIDAGGYYADTRRWAALMLLAAAALRIVWLGRPRWTRFGVATALLLGVLAPWQSRRRADAAAPAAAYAAWLVHAGVDWDWEVAVTTFAALACAAA